jgi:hypothetical protein
MAKKVKAEEEEAPAFKYPEFDEKEYLAGEIRDSKAIIAAALVAIPMAGIAAMITASVHPTLGILMGLAGFGVIFLLFRMLFRDLSAFKAKHWLMSLGGYFLTFLALWILMINPPFMDLSGPAIENPQYATSFGEFTDVEGEYLDLPTGTTDWILRVTVADNVDRSLMPMISAGGAPPVPMIPVDDKGTFEASISGVVSVTITAEDSNGHRTTYVLDVN